MHSRMTTTAPRTASPTNILFRDGVFTTIGFAISQALNKRDDLCKSINSVFGPIVTAIPKEQRGSAGKRLELLYCWTATLDLCGPTLSFAKSNAQSEWNAQFFKISRYLRIFSQSFPNIEGGDEIDATLKSVKKNMWRRFQSTTEPVHDGEDDSDDLNNLLNLMQEYLLNCDRSLGPAPSLLAIRQACLVDESNSTEEEHLNVQKESSRMSANSCRSSSQEGEKRLSEHPPQKTTESPANPSENSGLVDLTAPTDDSDNDSEESEQAKSNQPPLASTRESDLSGTPQSDTNNIEPILPEESEPTSGSLKRSRLEFTSDGSDDESHGDENERSGDSDDESQSSHESDNSYFIREKENTKRRQELRQEVNSRVAAMPRLSTAEVLELMATPSSNAIPQRPTQPGGKRRRREWTLAEENALKGEVTLYQSTGGRLDWQLIMNELVDHPDKALAEQFRFREKGDLREKWKSMKRSGRR